PELAVDLGCGPGHTTHLLADTLDCKRVVGLDNSKDFIDLAAKTATEKVSFLLHDVTRVPFPVGPCDLLFARYLLTHQADPAGLVSRWAGQLVPTGALLLEELDSIHCHRGEFADYISIVEAMFADSGYTLYLGPFFDASDAPEGFVKHTSKVRRHPVTTDVAARMFSMNIQTWKRNTFVVENYPAEQIAQLEKSLIDLAETPTAEVGAEWHLAQLTYKPAPR
ncbi:MAG: class I SAM-dependent methyltransferase, partial [Planctomycetota bacterium]